MEQNCNNIVDIHYQQTGEASATNELGMREMQAKAYEARNRRFLLIKAPPASVLVCAHATLRNGIARIMDGSILGYTYNATMKCLKKRFE